MLSVYDNASVYGSAKISKRAKVYGNAKIDGNTEIRGWAKVSGNTDVKKGEIVEMGGRGPVYDS